MPNSDALWAQLTAGNSDDLWQSATLSPDEQQQYAAKAQHAEAIAKRIEQNPYAVLDDSLALPGDRFTAALRAMEGREKNGTLDPLYYPKKFPIVGQALAAREALDAKTAIELVQNGSATAQEYYDAARYIKMLEAQGDWGSARRIANGILDMGGFVGDMLATGGIATATGKAAASGLGAQTAKTVAGRQAARLGGAAIGTVTQAGLMPQRTARSAIERSMDQISPNADGGIDVVKEGKSAPQAVAEGFGDTLTEVATERAGALIARFLPNKGLATGQAGRMLGAAPDGALARAGVQSLPIEMAEERLGDVIRGVTGLEDNFGTTGQALTGNFQPLLEEAAVLAVPGGVSLASQAAQAPAQRQQLDVLTVKRKDLQTTRTQQQEAFAAALQDPQAAQAWVQAHPEQAQQVASAENFSGHMARRVGLARIGTPEARATFQQNVREEVARQQAEQQRKDARWTRNPKEARFTPSELAVARADTAPVGMDPTPAQLADTAPTERVPSESEQFTELAQQIAARRNQEAAEWNAALDTLIGRVSGNERGAYIRRMQNALARGEDEDMQRGFDIIAQRARQEFPWLMQGIEGSPEANLMANIARGQRPRVSARDTGVLQEAAQYFQRSGAPLSESGDAKEVEPFATGELRDSFDVGAYNPERLADTADLNAVQQQPSQTPAPVVGFKTAKGSTYTVDSEGRTIRNKVLHAGHDPKDVGIKEQSVKTIYVDDDTAKEIGLWNTSSAQKMRIVLRGEQLILTSLNAKTGQRGSDGRFKIASTVPQVGLFPVELWKPDSDGFYRDNHPGNAIVEVTGGAQPNVGAYNPEVRQPSASQSVADTQPTEVLDAVGNSTSVAPEVTPTAPAVQSAPALSRLEGPPDAVSLTRSPAAAGIASPLIDITTPVKRGVKRVGSWLQKYMTSRGDLPQEAFERAVAKDATIAHEEQAIRNNANDLRDALKASTGSTTLTQAGQQQIDAALKGDQQALATLPPPVQTAITKMRDHIDTLSRRLLASGLPGQALELSINQNMGVYTTRSYRVFDDPEWKQNVPGNVRQAAFTHLQSVYPNETDQQINNRIDDMLTREQAPQALIKGSRLGSKDLGITRARKDIAPEIRALLGEYTDPQVNYARSATKIAHLVANHEFLKDVKQAGMGKFFFERDDAQRPEGYNVEFAAEGSKALEPLNGLMTTPEIKQAFQDVYAKDTPGWFLQQFLRANYAVKYGKTVGSLMTHVRNLTGNTMFAVQNGHWNLPKMGAALAATSSEMQQNAPTAVRSIWKTSAAWRDAFARYTKLGLVGDGIAGSELQAALNDSLDMTPAAVKESGLAKAIETGKQTLKALTTAYQLEDAVWKIYAFENERARYKAAYEKAGQPKTDAELDALAAKVVRDTYPTYSMVPRAVRGLRKAPLIGAFVSFPAEVLRTTFHSMKLAQQELNDPATRSIGAQRMAGNALALTIPYALTLGVRLALGIGDDEDRDLREFLPEWQKDADILWLSKPKDGKAEYVDLSYSMPNSALREPFHAMLRGEDAWDAFRKGSWNALEPFIGEDILAGKLLDIARNTTKNKREVYPEFGSDAAKAKAIGAHLYDAFEPGTVTSLKRIKKGVEGHVEPWGREYDPADEAIAMATGVRFQDVDAEQSLFFHARKFAQSKQKTTGMLSGTLGSKGNVTEEQVGKAYQDSEEARQQQFERLHRAAKAALNLGVPRDKVVSVLSSAGISATTKKDGTLSEAERVILGDYRPYKISRDLYERVRELPQGAARLATYEQASGDAETMAEFVNRDLVKMADAIVRPRPLKRADVTQWQTERQSALQWLRDQGVSRQQVLAAYGPELAKIKTPSYRAEKRRRLAQVLGGL